MRHNSFADEWTRTGRLEHENFDRTARQALKVAGLSSGSNELFHAANFIRKAMPFTSSIDNFLLSNAHRPDITALLITHHNQPI
jgi:hypothetical protein